MTYGRTIRARLLRKQDRSESHVDFRRLGEWFAALMR
jgi:hypothetical protein